MSEAEVERLKQLIRAWRDARIDWHNCPVSDQARFMRTWNAYGAAEKALEAAAVAVSADRTTEKLAEPSDDWQERELAAVDKLDKNDESRDEELLERAANRQALTDPHRLDWATAELAARTIRRVCRDAGYVAPEDLVKTRELLGRVCRAMDDICRALLITPPAHLSTKEPK